MNWKTFIVKGSTEFFSSNLVRGLSYGNHVVMINNLSIGHLKNFQNLIDFVKIEPNITL